MSRTAECPFSASIDSSHAPRLPGAMSRQEPVEDGAHVADDAHVDRDVLVDLGRVDLDVDLLRVRRVRLQVAGDAVVEAHPQRDQQIGLLDGGVHPRLAVHPHHAEVQRVRRREGADAEQRHRDGNLPAIRQLAHLRHRVADQDAVAREDHRALGGVDQGHRAAVFGKLRRRRRTPVRLRRRGVPVEGARGLLRILGDVDQHGPGPAALREVERLAHGRRDIVGAPDEVVVLRHRQRHAGDVGFLERVRADEAAADLARDADDGRRVHHRGRHPGDHVGGARTGRRDGDADPAGRARVAVGHVRRALLVPREDVADGIVQQCVVRGQDRAAGVPEHVGDPLAHEAFPENLRTGSLHMVIIPSPHRARPTTRGARTWPSRPS